jgi:hypothetical protein
MAYQVQGSCYPTLLSANEAAASASSGVVSSGSVVVATAVTESSITFQATDLATGSVVVREVPFTPQPCNLLSSSDGAQIGWLLLGAWAATYAVRWLADVVRRAAHLESSHDA